MKTIRIALLMYALLMIIGQAFAVEVSVIPSNQVIIPGSTFNINISIDPHGTAIAGAQLNIAFNRSLIRVNSITEGELFKNGGANTFYYGGTINNSKGTVINTFDVMIGKKNVSTKGTFIIINATVTGTSGTSEINLSNIKIANPKGNYVGLNVTNGSIILPIFISPPPKITKQPFNQKVSVGQTATFSVVAEGTSLSYQWKKNGVNIAGARNASYTILKTSLSDNGSIFRVNVTNSTGSVISNNATLTVLPAASNNLIKNSGFESGTASWSFYTGGSGTFTTASPGIEGTIAANLIINSGSTNIQLYQTDITLESNTRYRLSFAAYSTTGHDITVGMIKHVSPYTAYMPDYSVNLQTGWQTFTTEFTTSGLTGTVNDVRLQFWLAQYAVTGDKYFIDDVRLEKADTPSLPAITNHPVQQTVIEGKTATFSVVAEGTSLSYQWKKNGVNIVGATSASYTTPPTVLSENGSTFRVNVTNSTGSVISNNATLTVLPASINLIKNPGLESGTTSWSFYTGASGTFTAASPGIEGTKAANLIINSTSTNIQLYQKGITLEQNTRYRLSFAAYSTTGNDLTVNLIKDISPYTSYMPDYAVNIGTSWQTFKTEFTTIGFSGTVNDGRLMFWLAPFAAAGDKYYIDDIRLEKI